MLPIEVNQGQAYILTHFLPTYLPPTWDQARPGHNSLWPFRNYLFCCSGLFCFVDLLGTVIETLTSQHVPTGKL